MVFGDVLHWVDHVDAKVLKTLPVIKGLTEDEGRNDPLIVAPGPDRILWVAMNCRPAAIGSAHRIAKLVWNDDDATWVGPSIKINSKTIPVTGRLPPTTDKPPEIVDMVLRNSKLLIHTTGPDYSHSRYGCDYSALVELSPSGETTFLGAAPEGYGKFTLEKDELWVRAWKGGSRISLTAVQLDGHIKNELKFTPKLLDGIKAAGFLYACAQNHLWVVDNAGEVGHFQLES
jgi:hypothetical protein